MSLRRLSVFFLGVFLRTTFIVQMLQLAIKEVCSLLEDAPGSLTNSCTKKRGLREKKE